ncbi:uncharacterized protein PHACADRAFT_264031 [Phanerochaete carnosa HHB-10118-sp]|uniref:Uncharacterized protein n=1 Tax=Phanerochaete carnosa (strain HHB-10118-sp) TaxID=650164 RepID=K5VV06_PHACS|nr:uncharacterized protein PHACADRAFT_264031 [Phanerochaete carnosa HHB-10118-sp]EKM50650.1 hypothetical protein PHACADRAFT_264031 [Phanerochaete carnosa HHB-10118-sp]
MPWASLFDYSGLCFLWFNTGGWRDGEVTYHVGLEGKKAFLEKLRTRLAKQRQQKLETSGNLDQSSC